MNKKNPMLWSMIILAAALIVGVSCFFINPKATELPSDEAEETTTENAELPTSDVSQEIVSDLSDEEESAHGSGGIELKCDLDAVVSEIAGGRALADVAYDWNNTAEFSPDADVLIKMAVDSTKRYEIYGVISAQAGACGMILNDRIGGEDNWNPSYESWLYTGAPADEPTLSYEGEQLIFTYVYALDEQGNALTKTFTLDCGYDTGHMELVGGATGRSAVE